VFLNTGISLSLIFRIFILSENFIEDVKKSIVELPLQKMERFQKDYGLNFEESEIIASDKDFADF